MGFILISDVLPVKNAIILYTRKITELDGRSITSSLKPFNCVQLNKLNLQW